MRKCLVLLEFIALLVAILFCEEIKKYRYPLNINNGYSSSFQEFRSNHFHAGMDLRTFRKTGYPVYAIGDGKLVKIRMVKRGSGRGLYIKHLDGNTSIYFHLDRFNSSIENIVTEVQRARNRKYFGNYILKNPLNVKRGDMIAYSGETGYGFPHLHLEIRDSHYAAINPFPLVALPGRDRNYPVIRFLMFRNKSEDLINGMVGENLIRFKKNRAGIYQLRKPVIVTGYFDCLLGTRDISDSGKYVAPYEISLFIDENHFFRLHFDRFSWEDNNQLGFVYDMYYSNPGNYCYNLFFQKGFELEEKKVEPDSFFDQLGPGKHNCRIEVTDNYGNTSVGYFDLLKMETPQVELGNISFHNQSITLDNINIKSPDTDRIIVCLLDRQGNESFRGNWQYSRADNHRQVELKGIDEEVHFMDLLFIKSGIVYHRKRIRLRPYDASSRADIDFKLFINRDRVFAKIEDPLLTAGDLSLIVSQGAAKQTIKPGDSKESIFFSFTPMSTEPDITFDFMINGHNETVKSIQKKIRLVCLGSSKKQIFEDGEFSAEFYEHAVNERKVLQFEIKHHPSQYPVLTRQISLYPYHFPFLDYVYFQFRMSVPNPLQVGIFKYRIKNKKWVYVSTIHDKTTHTFRTKVLSSGIFALMRDIFPPVIYLNKISSQFLADVKQLIVTITDKGKGVNDDTLTVVINEKPIECEYDPDWRQVKIAPIRFLRRGKNTIRVSVADYGGNRTSKGFSFFLK